MHPQDRAHPARDTGPTPIPGACTPDNELLAGTRPDRAPRNRVRKSKLARMPRWAMDQAERTGRAPRLRLERRIARTATRTQPTTGDVWAARNMLQELASLSQVRGSYHGCSRVVATVLRLGGPARNRLDLGLETAATWRQPSWFWRCWAETGWRTTFGLRSWAQVSVRCSRWGLPSPKKRRSWRRHWAEVPWECRLFTATDWALARGGRSIPVWLHGAGVPDGARP